jgi:hypothetical protein
VFEDNLDLLHKKIKEILGPLKENALTLAKEKMEGHLLDINHKVSELTEERRNAQDG